MKPVKLDEQDERQHRRADEARQPRPADRALPERLLRRARRRVLREEPHGAALERGEPAALVLPGVWRPAARASAAGTAIASAPTRAQSNQWLLRCSSSRRMRTTSSPTPGGSVSTRMRPPGVSRLAMRSQQRGRRPADADVAVEQQRRAPLPGPRDLVEDRGLEHGRAACAGEMQRGRRDVDADGEHAAHRAARGRGGRARNPRRGPDRGRERRGARRRRRRRAATRPRGSTRSEPSPSRACSCEPAGERAGVEVPGIHGHQRTRSPHLGRLRTAYPARIGGGRAHRPASMGP